MKNYKMVWMLIALVGVMGFGIAPAFSDGDVLPSAQDIADQMGGEVLSGDEGLDGVTTEVIEPVSTQEGMVLDAQPVGDAAF